MNAAVTSPMHPLLQSASAKAARADFPALLDLCQQVHSDPAVTLDDLLDSANLLNHFGFLSDAEACCRQALSLSPKDLRPWALGDVAFAVIGPVALEWVIRPFGPKRRIVGNEQQHHLFEPLHVVSPGTRQPFPVQGNRIKAH